jgi:hypothetical protein
MQVNNKNGHDLVQGFIKIINQMVLANHCVFPKYFAQIQISSFGECYVFIYRFFRSTKATYCPEAVHGACVYVCVCVCVRLHKIFTFSKCWTEKKNHQSPKVPRHREKKSNSYFELSAVNIAV